MPTTKPPSNCPNNVANNVLAREGVRATDKIYLIRTTMQKRKRCAGDGNNANQHAVDNCTKRCVDEKCTTKQTHAKDANRGKFMCRYCPASIASKQMLGKHIIMKHEQWRKMPCPQCDKGFASVADVKRHVDTSHNKVKRFWCTGQCGKASCNVGYYDKSELKTHVSQEKTHQCLQCEKAFKDKSNLTEHVKNVHLKLRRLVCDIDNCRKSFGRLTDLKRHILSGHECIKQFQCQHPKHPECEFRCSHSGALNYHYKWHDGIRDQVCDLCGDAYGTPSELTRHRLTHDSDYVRSQKKQEKRIETALQDAGFTEDFTRGGVPPLEMYRREVQINFDCDQETTKSYARIDFVVTLTNGRVVFLEVDEFQHKRWSIHEETVRMECVYESVMKKTGAKQVWFVRFNPDPYRYNNVLQVADADRREAALIRYMCRCGGRDAQETHLLIDFAFYDKNDVDDTRPLICSDDDYPRHMLQCTQDITSILLK